MPCSSLSRRSSTPTDLSTMTRDQPFAIATCTCALMFGYFAALKRSRCTDDGRRPRPSAS
jgi:hypothetical protein